MRSQLATSTIQKDINVLHAELGLPSKVITHATGRAMGLYLTGTFKPCEDCAQKGCVSKKAVVLSKIFGERLFFDISSLWTPSFGSKKHWLLVVENSTDNSWSGNLINFAT